MLGGRLPETENKRVCQTSGLKTGRGGLRNLSSGRLRESSWNSIWLRNKIVIYKVVAHGRWSLASSGRYERVDWISVYRLLNHYDRCCALDNRQAWWCSECRHLWERGGEVEWVAEGSGSMYLKVNDTVAGIYSFIYWPMDYATVRNKYTVAAVLHSGVGHRLYHRVPLFDFTFS